MRTLFGENSTTIELGGAEVEKPGAKRAAEGTGMVRIRSLNMIGFADRSCKKAWPPRKETRNKRKKFMLSAFEDVSSWQLETLETATPNQSNRGASTLRPQGSVAGGLCMVP